MRAFLVGSLLVCSAGLGRALPAASSSSCDAPVVERIWTDATLHRQWESLADCRHPERPRQAASIAGSQPASRHPQDDSMNLSPARPVPGVGTLPAAAPKAIAVQIVHPGGGVQLWRQDGDSRIELAGTALRGGALGDVIAVRIAGSGRPFSGIVRGPGSVELARRPLAWDRP